VGARLAMHDDNGLQTCREGTFAGEHGNDGVAPEADIDLGSADLRRRVRT